MYQQLNQIERYHLVSLTQERQRERQHIEQVKLAEDCLERISLLQRVLTSLGWRMVEIGSKLVAHNSLTTCKDQTASTRLIGTA
jgi:hypothetical protein